MSKRRFEQGEQICNLDKPCLSFTKIPEVGTASLNYHGSGQVNEIQDEDAIQRGHVPLNRSILGKWVNLPPMNCLKEKSYTHV